MFAKPDRMRHRNYPDEALLARLKSVRLADADIPEHEFMQFRRLQALVYTLRLSGYDLEAMQTEPFVGAARDEFQWREWNLQRLTVSYWYKLIL
jgi:hypothetical protein